MRGNNKVPGGSKNIDWGGRGQICHEMVGWKCCNSPFFVPLPVILAKCLVHILHIHDNWEVIKVKLFDNMQ